MTAWDQLPRAGSLGAGVDDPWWKGLRPLCLREESWKEECCFLSHWEGQDQNGKGSGLGIWPKTSDGGFLSVRIVLSGTELRGWLSDILWLHQIPKSSKGKPVSGFIFNHYQLMSVILTE